MNAGSTSAILPLHVLYVAWFSWSDTGLARAMRSLRGPSRAGWPSMLVSCSAVAMVTPDDPQMRRKSPSAAMVSWTIRSPVGPLAAGAGDDAGADPGTAEPGQAACRLRRRLPAGRPGSAARRPWGEPGHPPIGGHARAV